MRGNPVIVNVMALSKIQYLATVCTPPKDILNRVDIAVQNSVWSKNKNKSS